MEFVFIQYLPLEVLFTCAVVFVGHVVNAAVHVTVTDELRRNTTTTVTSQSTGPASLFCYHHHHHHHYHYHRHQQQHHQRHQM